MHILFVVMSYNKQFTSYFLHFKFPITHKQILNQIRIFSIFIMALVYNMSFDILLYQLVPGERRHHFDPDAVCPLILESDYRRHVLTHIISLLESREGHIRQVLLENLEGFSSVCTSEDMETIVLPQVSADLYHVHMRACTFMLHCN